MRMARIGFRAQNGRHAAIIPSNVPAGNPYLPSRPAGADISFVKSNIVPHFVQDFREKSLVYKK